MKKLLRPVLSVILAVLLLSTTAVSISAIDLPETPASTPTWYDGYLYGNQAIPYNDENTQKQNILKHVVLDNELLDAYIREELNINSNRTLTQADLDKITDITFDVSIYGEISLADLGLFKNLTSITVIGYGAVNYEFLADNKQLENFVAIGVDEILNLDLRLNPILDTVVISDSNVGESFIWNLNATQYGLLNTDITDVSYLADLKGLEVFSFKGAVLEGFVEAFANKTKTMKTLELNSVKLTTDELAVISKLTGLTSLSLVKADLTNADTAYLKTLRNLLNIDIAGNSIYNYVFLRSLRKLETVNYDLPADEIEEEVADEEVIDDTDVTDETDATEEVDGESIEFKWVGSLYDETIIIYASDDVTPDALDYLAEAANTISLEGYETLGIFNILVTGVEGESYVDAESASIILFNVNEVETITEIFDFIQLFLTENAAIDG
jgi:hypothetical protein